MNPYFTVGAPDDENRDSEYWLAVRHSIDCVDDYDAKPTSLWQSASRYATSWSSLKSN